MRKLLNLPNSILKYTVAAIIIMVPLYPKFPFLRIPGTFVSIRIEDLLLAWSAFLLVWLLVPRLVSFLKNRITQSVMLFIFVGLVSTLSAIWITQTAPMHIGFLHWARRIEYLIPVFLGMEAIRRERKSLDFFLKIFLIVVGICFLYGLGQRYLSWPVIITQNAEYSKGVALRWTSGSHINSTFAGHYDLSTFLIVILPVFISALFILKGKLTKGILLSITLCGLWLLVNAASRISLASYLGAITIALFLAKKYWAIPMAIIVSLVFVGFSSNLISRYTRIFEVIKMDIQVYTVLSHVYASDEVAVPRRIVTPTPTPVPVFEDRSTNIRLVVEWPRAIRAFTKNPLLGTGYSSITLATDNDYLRALGEVGLLGFVAFMLIWVQIGLAYLKVFPFSNHFSGLELAFICGVAGGIAGVFVNALFIDVFEASKFMILFMLMIGFSLGLIAHEKNI
jgi:hypothetical protein